MAEPQVVPCGDASGIPGVGTSWYDVAHVFTGGAVAPLQVARSHREGPAVIVGHVAKRLVRGMVVGIVRRWVTSLLVVGLLVGTVVGLASQGMMRLPGVTSAAGGAAAATSTDVREMQVEDIRTARNSDQITLVLKEKAGNRRLVMSVGQSEALAIVADFSAMQSRARPKIDPPTSYDLMRSLVRELGGNVSRVVVNHVSNETFYAKVVMHTDNRQVEVDSRPSDAIALALRARVPIFAEASVLDKAGVGGS
jgi:bifunctional DNase/RNase